MKKIALLLLYYFQNFICSYKQQVVHRVFYLMESFALLYLQLEDHSETFAQFMQTMTQRKQTPAKGKLISKCPFGVFKSPKKQQVFFPGLLP